MNAAALVLDTLEGKDPASGKVIREPIRLVDCYGVDSKEEDSFRWRFVIAAEVARAERERIKARNVRTRERLTGAGRFAGGAVPFGCRVVPNPDGGGKVLRVQEEEASILREAASRLIRGDSMRGTVRHLNETLGSRTRRGIEWQRSSLRSSLLSSASQEFVFDRSTFRALRESLTTTPAKWRNPGGRPVTSLLAGGGAVCGSCGRKLTTTRSRSERNPYHRYVCISTSGGDSCPETVSISLPALDERVEAEYLARFGRLDHVEPRVMLSGAEDLEAAEADHEAAQAALLSSPGPETLAAFQSAQERLHEEQAKPQNRERVLVATGKTIAEVWQESDAPGRAALVVDALDGRPVVVEPASRFPRAKTGRQGAAINWDRVSIPWRTDEIPDYLAGQLD